MIKFFRQIRFDLMEKNKTGKYLKYAIGEIVLVVIGILFALQINNWNENRKAIEKSKVFLNEIKKDLETDTILFKKGYLQISEQIDDDEWALIQMDYNMDQVERLWDCFSGWYYDYYINDRTFQKVQNDPNAKIIGFDTLYNRISNYYTLLNNRLNAHVQWDVKEVTERQEYMQELENHLEINNYRMLSLSSGLIIKEFTSRQDPLESAKLMIEFANSTTGRNHFKNNYVRHIRVREVFNEVSQEAKNLIIAINQELNSENKNGE